MVSVVHLAAVEDLILLGVVEGLVRLLLGLHVVLQRRFGHLADAADDLGNLAGVTRLEDVTGHLGLGVVRRAPDQVGEVGQVVAVVDEPGDEVRLVLEDEDGRVGVVGRHAADERRQEHQLDLPGLDGTPSTSSTSTSSTSTSTSWSSTSTLAPPADLGHQPRQHGQGGAAVQGGPADVPQAEALVRPALLPLVQWTLHLSLGCVSFVEFLFVCVCVCG